MSAFGRNTVGLAMKFMKLRKQTIIFYIFMNALRFNFNGVTRTIVTAVKIEDEQIQFVHNILSLSSKLQLVTTLELLYSNLSSYSFDVFVNTHFVFEEQTINRKKT